MLSERSPSVTVKEVAAGVLSGSTMGIDMTSVLGLIHNRFRRGGGGRRCRLCEQRGGSRSPRLGQTPSRVKMALWRCTVNGTICLAAGISNASALFRVQRIIFDSHVARFTHAV